MKILIIGGTGHVGSFLVPKLVGEGHEVYVGTRGNTALKRHVSYDGVTFLSLDATNVEELRGLRSYNFHVIIDMPGTAWEVWCALKDSVDHIIACGSLWMYGNPNKVPTPEVQQSECPFPRYAKRFEKIQYMIAHSGENRAVFTSIMPSNICGPGKVPLECMGGRNIDVHKAHMTGDKVVLPEGPECIISPCDAEDIAELFALAVNNREIAAGQMFNAGSGHGITASRFVEIYSEIYGVQIPIERVSWSRYIEEISPGITAWWHFYAHMLPDISKAQKLLGYKPKYTPEQSMRRAVEWMKEEGKI